MAEEKAGVKMAEEKAGVKMAEEKAGVKVYNKGRSRFMLKKGEGRKPPTYLEPGDTAEVAADVAKVLIASYPRDIVDLGKMPKAMSAGEIQKGIKDRDEKIAELKKALEAAEAKIADLLATAKKGPADKPAVKR